MANRLPDLGRQLRQRRPRAKKVSGQLGLHRSTAEWTTAGRPSGIQLIVGLPSPAKLTLGRILASDDITFDRFDRSKSAPATTTWKDSGPMNLGQKDWPERVWGVG